MAVKNTQVEKKSRVLEYLQTEHKWETYLFIFLSLALMVLGIFILNGTLGVDTKVPVISSFPKTFAIIILVIASASFIYAVFPFFKNSWPEAKKVTLPNWALFLGNILKVFTFLAVFTVLYLMYDVLVTELISGLLKLR